ncbi:MAG: FKBP-type peptidyl-prolyl cis-trans isomerase [Candidatus Kariarchaeaceae archaeon]
MKHSRTKIALISSIIILGLLISLNASQTSAYIKDEGLSENDQANVRYRGYFTNGSVFDSGGDLVFTVKTGSGGVIQGFYNILIGMEVGDSKTGAIVPPELGYTGDHLLAGETLLFDVRILLLVYDAYLEDGDQVAEFKSKDTGIGNALSGVTGFITFAIGALFFGVIALFAAPPIIAALKPKCAHCGAKADIVCGNPTCGTKACYSCFSKGCPSCKSRKMTPL